MSVVYTREGKTIKLDVTFENVGKTAILEIVSDRNRKITRMSDISPYDPNRTPGVDRYPEDVDTWFPVVDLKIEPRIYGKVWVSSDYQQPFYFNSYMNHDAISLATDNTATIDSKWLVDWENGLYLNSKTSTVEKFALVKEVPMLPTISKRVSIEFETLIEDWGGTVAIYYIDNSGNRIYDSTLTILRPPVMERTAKIFTSEMEEALDLCLHNLINSHNHAINSPQKNGLYLFYDLDAETYRNGQWPWSWGPAIRLMLDAAKLDNLENMTFSKEKLMKHAKEICDTSLKFQIYNPEHPAHYFSTTRYTARTYEAIGYQELVNTGSDGGFLAGWGWAALYEETGDAKYKEAIENYISVLKPVLDSFVIPPQEWLPAQDDWTTFTIEESGFGTEGIDALYKITKDTKYQDLCRQYIDEHVAVLGRPDGLWNRQYNFPTQTVDETTFMTRGMGWAMEGLLAAYRCTLDSSYLEQAIKMGEVLISHQKEDGSWNFEFTKTAAEVGVADKGTSLWSLLLYMLHSYTQNPAHLAAARAALNWCIKNQYKGTNPHAYGGIVSQSAESGITYRSWFKMTCQYTTAFFGLALLEEMKLS